MHWDHKQTPCWYNGWLGDRGREAAFAAACNKILSKGSEEIGFVVVCCCCCAIKAAVKVSKEFGLIFATAFKIEWASLGNWHKAVVNCCQIEREEDGLSEGGGNCWRCWFGVVVDGCWNIVEDENDWARRSCTASRSNCCSS